MARVNTSRNGDQFSTTLNGSAMHANHAMAAEHPTMPSSHADGVDYVAFNWESAWIDLGGEG